MIIAGGGGGAYSHETTFSLGGNGGGLNGGKDPSGCSPVGTQNGCDDPSNSRCGSIGIGYSNWFGAGGGGKYGGGNCDYKGGGGGSGSLDGVTHYLEWKEISSFSDHSGPGSASITIIKAIEVVSCIVKRTNLFLFLFMQILVTIS